jgi:hypothetical protein
LDTDKIFQRGEVDRVTQTSRQTRSNKAIKGAREEVHPI